jgi:hypothetical protein
MAIIPSLIFLFVGALMLLVSWNLICFAIPVFMFSLYYAVTYPLAAQAHFNFAQGEVIFTATYLFRLPRHIDWRAPINAMTGLSLPPRLHWHSAIDLTFQDGTRLLLEFDLHQQKVHPEFLHWLKTVHRKQRVSELESNSEQ